MDNADLRNLERVLAREREVGTREERLRILGLVYKAILAEPSGTVVNAAFRRLAGKIGDP